MGGKRNPLNPPRFLFFFASWRSVGWVCCVAVAYGAASVQCEEDRKGGSWEEVPRMEVESDRDGFQRRRDANFLLNSGECHPTAALKIDLNF